MEATLQPFVCLYSIWGGNKAMGTWTISLINNRVTNIKINSNQQMALTGGGVGIGSPILVNSDNANIIGSIFEANGE